MPIVLRSQKGASLTFTELDGNFIDLNQRVGDISERISTIESDTVTWDEIENKPNTLDGFGLDEVFDGNYNNLINKPTIPSLLTDLSNVSNTVVPNTGQVLKWDGNQWAPADEEAGTGSAVDLTAFTVSVHPPEEAPNLTYDNETGQFQYTPPNLALYALASSLSTVAASGDYSDLANTPSLATVATTGNYSDLTGKPAIPFNIGDLNNVSSTSPTVGQALTWNGSTWSPSTVSTGDGGGATTLDGLSDVSTTGVANNNILKYNGTTSAWEIGSVNYTEILNTPTIPSDINELSDNDGLLTIPTDISDLTDNTNLLFDGTYGSLTGNPTSLGFPTGVAITEFSSDGTLADNSSSAVPTESAVKTYVDTTIGDFTFTNTTLDTTGSAAITVTPDVTFNGTVTVNSFSSVGTGNLAFTSAASVNITAADDINLSATNITGLGNEAYDNFGLSTAYSPGLAVSHNDYLNAEAVAGDNGAGNDIEAGVTITSGYSKIKVELDASVVNITDATTEMIIALERSINGANPTDVKQFLFPPGQNWFGSQHFTYVDTHGASAGDTVSYKLRVDMSSYSNESARIQFGICGDTLYIKEIR